MKNISKHTCADCGKDFDSTASCVRYCHSCRLKRFRPKNDFKLICAYPRCGKAFISSMPWAKYCCAKHRVEDYNRRMGEELLRQQYGQ